MRKILYVFLGLFVFCGCVADTGTEHVSAHDLKPGIIIPTLRVGVKVRISVSAMGAEVFPETLKEVSSEGTIVLPYINTVQCAGMRIEDFQKLLTERYAEFYLEPLVSAYYVPEEGGSSPYGSVLVTGSVGRPGMVSIPQTCDLTVMQALQNAGGMGAWAEKSKVRVTRSLADGTKQTVTVDVEEIGQRGATDQNVVLMPGDVIHVPEISW